MKKTYLLALSVALVLTGAGCQQIPTPDYPEPPEGFSAANPTIAVDDLPTDLNSDLDSITIETSQAATGEPPLGHEGSAGGVVGEGPDQSVGANGPQVDSIYSAFSTDGATWEMTETAVQQMASVPDLTKLNVNIGALRAGELITVFVDASNFTRAGEERIGMMVSSDDGRNWTEMTNIEIAGAENHIPVDPSIVQTPEGALRIFYYDFTDSVNPNKEHVFYSAISYDGINYTLEGEVFRDFGITDPDAVYFNDTWYLFFADTSTQEQTAIQFATSTDGYTFTEQDVDTGTTGIPGAWVQNDGALSLFGCGQGGLVYSTSTDGINWAIAQDGILKETQMLLCDPGAVQLEDNSWVMIFKSREM